MSYRCTFAEHIETVKYKTSFQPINRKGTETGVQNQLIPLFFTVLVFFFTLLTSLLSFFVLLSSLLRFLHCLLSDFRKGREFLEVQVVQRLDFYTESAGDKFLSKIGNHPQVNKATQSKDHDLHFNCIFITFIRVLFLPVPKVAFIFSYDTHIKKLAQSI